MVKNKKAVSLMVSYVILISIAIGLSIGVFVWLKDYANISPKIDCKDGTTIRLEDYDLSKSSEIKLTLKNSGLFNIDGVIVHVGNNTQQMPIKRLSPDLVGEIHSLAGYYDFDQVLEPSSDSREIAFIKGYDYPYDIKVISIQPYIRNEKGAVIVCESGSITEAVV